VWISAVNVLCSAVLRFKKRNRWKYTWRIEDFIKLSGPVNAVSERAADVNRVKTPCLPNHYTCGTLLWYLLYFVGPGWGGEGSNRSRDWKPVYIQYVLSSRTSNLLLQLDTWLNRNPFGCLRLFIRSLTSHKGKLLLAVVGVPLHCISLKPDTHERLCVCKIKFGVSQHFWSHRPPKRTSR